MMKPFHLASASALLALTFATPSLAQNGANPEMLEKPASMPHRSGTGTAPEGMGSTGWTGGTRGETKSNSDPEAAREQPFMATGADLKGPPTQFPAGQTPE